MKLADELLDSDPSLENIKMMVENDIRNKLVFKELDAYSKTGKFLYKHPYLRKQRTYNQLRKLKREKPEEFLKTFSKTEQSITRYKSVLKNKKYKSEEEKQSWLLNMDALIEKQTIITDLIKE